MEVVKSSTFEVRRFERKSCTEQWLNYSNDIDHLQEVFDYLKARHCDVISIRLISDSETIEKAISIYRKNFGDEFCPPLCLLEDDGSLKVQIHAVSSKGSRPLYYNDRLIGRAFEDEYADYYMLRALPDNTQADEFTQAKNIFEKFQACLQGNGLEFDDTIKTWLYARDILSWYGELNRARNAFYKNLGVYDKLVPASTGIGSCNFEGAALATQLFALRPKNNGVLVKQANSPLQNPAWEYKSSFSRAVEALMPDHNRLYISGTASIDKEGNTIYLDDTPSQIDWTMKVVEAILGDINMSWQDVATSLVYFKDKKDFSLFDQYCQNHNIEIPHIKVHADICREDLLFELQLDAIQRK